MNLECKTVGSKVYVINKNDKDESSYGTFEDLHGAVEAIRLVKRLIKFGVIKEIETDDINFLKEMLERLEEVKTDVTQYEMLKTMMNDWLDELETEAKKQKDKK